MLPTNLFPSRRRLHAALALIAFAALAFVADRAEAQSLTGGMQLLLGPPEAQGGQPVLGAPQDGQTAPPPDAQQPPPQTVYIVETQAPPPGYGQPGYGQQGPMMQGAMGPSAQASQEAQAESDGRIPRLIFEPFVGYAVGWTFGGIGALIGMGAGGCFSLDSSWFASSSCYWGIVTGAAVGLVLGTAFGVSWAGSWFDGMGSLGSTLLGSAGGVLLFVLVAGLAQDGGAVAGSALLPVAGAMIGYELSSSSNASAGLAGVALTPVFDGGRATGATAGVRFAY